MRDVMLHPEGYHDWFDEMRCKSWLINTMPEENIGQIFKAMFANENGQPAERDAMVQKMDPATRMLYEVIKYESSSPWLTGGTCYKSTDCSIIE